MYIYMPCWTHILFAAQDSLEFTIFLPLPPECWLGLQGVPPHPTQEPSSVYRCWCWCWFQGPLGGAWSIPVG